MQRIERHQPTELHRNHSIRLGVDVADVPEITNETLHRSRHHRLAASDHDEHLVTRDADFALDVANQLATIDVEEIRTPSAVCSRIPVSGRGPGLPFAQ